MICCVSRSVLTFGCVGLRGKGPEILLGHGGFDLDVERGDFPNVAREA